MEKEIIKHFFFNLVILLALFYSFSFSDLEKRLCEKES